MARNYLEGLLGDNEQIILETHQHWFVLFGKIFLELLLIALLIGGSLALSAFYPLAIYGLVLERLPLISYAEDLPIARRYWRHVFNRRLHAPAAVTVPDLRGVLTVVIAGAGWSVLPSYLCRAELASGALRLLHEPEDPQLTF